MPIRDVLIMGDPRLYEVSKVVENISDPAISALVEDLFESMVAYNGIGMAASQIGVLQRVMIFGFEKNSRYPKMEAVAPTVLINPEITVLDEEQELGWEGCLSVPGLRGIVPRYKAIKYQGYGIDGVLIEQEVTDMHARVVQHELDHLDGILFPLRVKSRKALFCEKESMQYIQEGRLPEGIC